MRFGANWELMNIIWIFVEKNTTILTIVVDPDPVVSVTIWRIWILIHLIKWNENIHVYCLKIMKIMTPMTMAVKIKQCNLAPLWVKKNSDFPPFLKIGGRIRIRIRIWISIKMESRIHSTDFNTNLYRNEGKNVRIPLKLSPVSLSCPPPLRGRDGTHIYYLTNDFFC